MVARMYIILFIAVSLIRIFFSHTLLSYITGHKNSYKIKGRGLIAKKRGLLIMFIPKKSANSALFRIIRIFVYQS